MVTNQAALVLFPNMKKFILSSQQHLKVGLYAFVISALFLGVLNPSIALMHVHAIVFFLECTAFLMLLIGGRCLLGSVDATMRAGRLVTNDRRAFVYVVWVCLMIALCGAWGGTAYNVVAILEHATARADARLPAKFLRWESYGKRGGDKTFAVFDTGLGQMDVLLRAHPRVSNAGFAMPFDLAPGDGVVLVGKASSMIFVLKSVDVAASPQHAPQASTSHSGLLLAQE